MLGALRERWPDLDFALHLHDTRGMAIANAFAGLEMGVTASMRPWRASAAVPFAGHQGAAGNVCTEDLVFMCNELGIETGIDLDALIECAKLAEDVVGHPLPGAVMKGGTLEKFRGLTSVRLPARRSSRSPLAVPTMRVPTSIVARMKMIERVRRTTSQCASTNSPSCTAPTNCTLSSMVACGLPPVARCAVMPMA